MIIEYNYHDTSLVDQLDVLQDSEKVNVPEEYIMNVSMSINIVLGQSANIPLCFCCVMTNCFWFSLLSGIKKNATAKSIHVCQVPEVCGIVPINIPYLACTCNWVYTLDKCKVISP